MMVVLSSVTKRTHLFSNMKTRLTFRSWFVVLGFIYQCASAGDMMSFESWKKSTPNWAKDESELGYALTRCGVLFQLVGVYVTENGAKTDKKMGESFIDDGKNLLSIGLFTSAKNGMNDDSIRRRHKVIMDTYISDIKKNKSLNNNFLYGDTGSDVQFCGTLNKTVKEP